MSILMIEGWARLDPTLYAGPAALQASFANNQIEAKTFAAISDQEKKRLIALYDDRARVVQPIDATERLSLNVTV